MERKRTGRGGECQDMCCKYLSVRNKTTYQIFSRDLSFMQLALMLVYSFSSCPLFSFPRMLLSHSRPG